MPREQLRCLSLTLDNNHDPRQISKRIGSHLRTYPQQIVVSSSAFLRLLTIIQTQLWILARAFYFV